MNKILHQRNCEISLSLGIFLMVLEVPDVRKGYSLYLTYRTLSGLDLPDDRFSLSTTGVVSRDVVWVGFMREAMTSSDIVTTEAVGDREGLTAPADDEPLPKERNPLECLV
jgi:hypothetical protein